MRKKGEREKEGIKYILKLFIFRFGVIRRYLNPKKDKRKRGKKKENEVEKRKG